MRKALILGLTLLGVGTAYAVPALPGLIEVSQPDGSIIKVRLYGDENFHYYTDESGNYLEYNPSGFLVASNRKPEAPEKKQRAPWKAEGTKYTSYPTVGNQKALVMLVEFSDRSFTYGREYFDGMLNQTGYGSYGSARDYYIENSGGNFVPEFDVFGPVLLSHPMSYYSADDDAKAYEMVVEACRALDGEVNFADYDRDNDGWVDNVYVFYAGYGEADGGGINTVWPHSSNVFRKGTTLLLDGVQIGQYACSNELMANTRNLVGIGTFCHEFGHVLGLPDLYSTSDASIITPGYWSLMDHGNYANNGFCPVAMTAYERYFLGWSKPLVISGKSSVLLPSVDNNFGYRVNGSDAEEYFILEYRRKSGWDTFAPGEGLLVWHIDYDRDAWDMNTVNNYESQQRVRILPADGIRTQIGDGGDTYPGTAGITSIDDFKSWNGATAGLTVSDIRSNGAYITFNVNGGDVTPSAPDFEISEITDCEASLNFKSGSSPLVSLSFNEEGRKRFVPGYTFAGQETASVFENLSPDTEYTVTAYASSGSSLSIPAEKSFITSKPGIRFFAPENLTITDVTNTGFTISWDEVEGASEYLVTVSHEGSGDAAESIVDFSDKTNLPDGWTTSAVNTMSVNGYYGNAAPSLRMSNNAETIESPVFDEPVKTLSFWIRGYQANAASSISIYGLIGDKWELIETLSGVDNTAGKTYAYSEEELRDAKALRFVYNAVSGSICVDDIRVGLGNAVVTVKDLDGVSSGQDTCFVVDNLETQTTYRVFVVGFDGKHESIPSEIMEVTTGKVSSVAETLNSNSETEIYDVTGSLLIRTKRASDIVLPKGLYIFKNGKTTRKILIN